MAKIFAIVLFCAYLSTAFTAPVVEDEDGNQYYLIPIEEGISGGERAPSLISTEIEHGLRQKRQSDHQWKAGVIANGRPLTLGGQVGYQHVPSGSNLNVGAANSRYHGMNLGTSVSADGRLNLWRNNNGRLDAVGNYQRNFGGVGGTTRPNYYGGLQFKHRF